MRALSRPGNVLENASRLATHAAQRRHVADAILRLRRRWILRAATNAGDDGPMGSAGSDAYTLLHSFVQAQQQGSFRCGGDQHAMDGEQPSSTRQR